MADDRHHPLPKRCLHYVLERPHTSDGRDNHKAIMSRERLVVLVKRIPKQQVRGSTGTAPPPENHGAGSDEVALSSGGPVGADRSSSSCSHDVMSRNSLLKSAAELREVGVFRLAQALSLIWHWHGAGGLSNGTVTGIVRGASIKARGIFQQSVRSAAKHVTRGQSALSTSKAELWILKILTLL